MDGRIHFQRADWVIDQFAYETRGLYERRGWVEPRGNAEPERFTRETWIERDLCDREPFPFDDDEVDFVVCSQTLEDVRDPVWVCFEMQRVGKAGYIEVPSRLEEQSWGIAGEYVGWPHHTWLVDVGEAAIEFAHKSHAIHADPSCYFPFEFWQGLRTDERVQSLWWEGAFSACERVLFDEEVDAADYLASFSSSSRCSRAASGGPALVRSSAASAAEPKAEPAEGGCRYPRPLGAELSRPDEQVASAGEQAGNGVPTKSELVGQARRRGWYHSIELAPDYLTEGWFDLRPYVHRYGLPERMDGMRALDVGTWDGFWAFEMERRGAEVVALDLDDQRALDYPPRRRPDAFPSEPRGTGFRARPRRSGLERRARGPQRLRGNARAARNVRPRLLRIGVDPPSRPAPRARAHGEPLRRSLHLR